MPTIAFVSSKGGVGKTTSALLLGLGLARSGRDAVLVDSDPNLPLTAWASKRPPPPRLAIVQAPRYDALPGALRQARKQGDWVVVDTEGGAPRLGALAVGAADLVVAPLAASHLEAREALKMKTLVDEVSARDGRPIAFVCLFARTPGGFRRSFETIRAELKGEGAALLETVLTDREAFRTVFAVGGGLEDLTSRQAPGLAAARALASAFAEEIVEIFSP